MRKVGKSQGLQPGKSPPWLAKRLLRWKQLFGMAHWLWDVHWVSKRYLNAGTDHKEGGPTTYGRCDPLVPYLSAQLYFSNTLRNDDWGRTVAFHEARHAYYAAFLTHALRRDLIDRYVPARERRHVNRQLDDMIETLIEMDTLQFRQLTEL
ncbi:MAG TPA: hypothetical protein VK421_08165 [Pyrinomonadaceae bacterium]|nr:hypothetical protein [Pyrinomonadaceae bacterium]